MSDLGRLRRRDFNRIVAASFAGLVLGAGCTKSESEDDGAAKKRDPDLHACKGRNECKGHGGCNTESNACKGQNECKGQGGCATVDHHSCAGKNECAGQGGCRSSDNGCIGKSSCEGKGGCAVPVKH